MKYDVAVVGSGFSAISLVTNLLQCLPSNSSIAIVSDDSAFGRGTAYRTELHLHRLNVPAARMSAFSDRPGDFMEWLARKGRDVTGRGFASRHDYGLYLRDTLASLLRSQHHRARVDFVKAKAISCYGCGHDETVFRLNDGRELAASAVALCLGVGTASLPRLTSDADMGLLRRVVRNPWRMGWLSRVGIDDTVVILGSGLTMIDQVLSLRDRGHRGQIHVVSRRGLVPHSHSAVPVDPVEPRFRDKRMGLSHLLFDLRTQVRSGSEWRGVMDGLRHETQTLWQGLTQEQRSRFLRHGLAWWNIHRHRVAPQVYGQFDRLIKDGTVTVHAGFVSKISRVEQGNELVFRQRGTSSEKILSFDWLVNCTGMERAGIGHSPLLQDMVNRQMLDTDPLGLGVRVDETSRLLTVEGDTHAALFAVGALTAGQFWEITAVPDIRNQTREVAESISRLMSKNSS